MIITGLLVGAVVLVGLFVLGLGLLVLWGSSQGLWTRWAAFVGALRSRDWAETQGTVTRSVITHLQTRRSVCYSAAIRYTYGVRGTLHVGERVAFVEMKDDAFDAARAMIELHHVGSTPRVYFDPAGPSRATLDRSAPPVVLFSLGWLLVALVGAVVAAGGVSIAFGAFDEPPQLGELPSMQAQVGGLLAATGALAILVAGIRALLERQTRRLLRRLESAKPTHCSDVRAGDLVAAFGRAEEDLDGPSDEDLDGPSEDAGPEGSEASELEPGQPGGSPPGELPFEGAFYVHTDLGSTQGNLTQVTPFAVRDETGAVRVEPDLGRSLLRSHQLPIQGDVERWLDQHDLEFGASVCADRRSAMSVEHIREGDSILIVGQAFDDAGAGVVLRASADDPLSLLLADVPLPDLVEKLKRRPRATLALCAAGGLLIILGALALWT